MSSNSGQFLITNYWQVAAPRPEKPEIGTTDTHSASTHMAKTIVTTMQHMPIKRRGIVIDDDDFPETESIADAGSNALDGCAVLINNAEVEITHETPAPAAASTAIMPKHPSHPQNKTTAGAGRQHPEGRTNTIGKKELANTNGTPAQEATVNVNRPRTQRSESKQKHRHGKHHRDRTGKRRSRCRSPSPTPPSSVRHPIIALLILLPE